MSAAPVSTAGMATLKGTGAGPVRVARVFALALKEATSQPAEVGAAPAASGNLGGETREELRKSTSESEDSEADTRSGGPSRVSSVPRDETAYACSEVISAARFIDRRSEVKRPNTKSERRRPSPRGILTM